MAKAKRIFALVKRLSGPNKGKSYKRYFKSEAHKAEVMPRYSGKAVSEKPGLNIKWRHVPTPKEAEASRRWAESYAKGFKKTGSNMPRMQSIADNMFKDLKKAKAAFSPEEWKKISEIHDASHGVGFDMVNKVANYLVKLGREARKAPRIAK